MTYNLQRHIQLLKHSQDLKNQGKSFYEENEKEYLELSSYDIAVEQNIFWQQRYQVNELMQNFLDKKIDGQEFCDRVFGLRRNLMIASDQFLVQLGAGEVKDFQPDLRSKKLRGFLTGLFCYCDDFMEDYENDQFSNAIQNGFLNFQKAINEESSIKEIYIELPNILKNYRENAKISSNFVKIVDQLNWENQDHYIELIEVFLADSSNFLNLKEKYYSILEVAKKVESDSLSLGLSYQSLGFSNYILILIELFDACQRDSSICQKVFKSWVRKILFEMKNHYS